MCSAGNTNNTARPMLSNAMRYEWKLKRGRASNSSGDMPPACATTGNSSGDMPLACAHIHSPTSIPPHPLKRTHNPNLPATHSQKTLQRCLQYPVFWCLDKLSLRTCFPQRLHITLDLWNLSLRVLPQPRLTIATRALFAILALVFFLRRTAGRPA